MVVHWARVRGVYAKPRTQFSATVRTHLTIWEKQVISMHSAPEMTPEQGSGEDQRFVADEPVEF
jgi:hypothetical protein